MTGNNLIVITMVITATLCVLLSSSTRKLFLKPVTLLYYNLM